MQLPLSFALASRLVLLPAVGSTNDELVAKASAEPEFSVIATTNQTAGRGRLGRVWLSPAGKTLAVSVLLRPRLPDGQPVPTERFGWLPLLAGTAMARAVDSILTGHRVSLKWPNDVQVDGLKVSGLLAEFVPPDAVVVGAGLNLEMTADELPTPTSTSLRLNGASAAGDALVDLALSAYLCNLRSLYEAFLAGGADATASGLLGEVTRACSTIGQDVRVQLPGGDDLLGTAEGLDGSGRLIVRRRSDRQLQSVAAGDVTHLRYE